MKHRLLVRVNLVQTASPNLFRPDSLPAGFHTRFCLDAIEIVVALGSLAFALLFQSPYFIAGVIAAAAMHATADLIDEIG